MASINVRYQVFVGSTYTDLKEERDKIMQTLMQLNCIPAGMELFPAMDLAQFEFIKTVIDDSDYYLLIIGGRYGSVSADGISFTEKEFDYAVNTDKKVLAFIHEDPFSIPAGKTDLNDGLRDKLKVFRDRVIVGRLVKYWRSADQLSALLATTLPQFIRMHEAVGWVRGDKVTDSTTLSQMTNLLREKKELEQKVMALQDAGLLEERKAELEDFTDTVEVPLESNSDAHYLVEQITWGQLFKLIGPIVEEFPSDALVRTKLPRLLADHFGEPEYEFTILNEQFYTLIKIQFKALGLVDLHYNDSSRQTGMTWYLTDHGEAALVELFARKKSLW